MHTKETLLVHLCECGIPYTLYEHEAFFTVEQGKHIAAAIPGVHCKNLFLKNKAGALFLLTVPDSCRVDLKSLPDKIGSKRFSFGSPELLLEILGVMPGSVTPLALANAPPGRVALYLDAWMMRQAALNVHPLVNTASVSLRPDDLLKFLASVGCAPRVLPLS